MHMDAQTVTLIFTIVTGIGVLLQAAVLFGIALGLRETQKKLLGLTERLEEHIVPVISTSRGLLEDISPKVKTITSNLVDASGTLRAQAENVGHVVNDAAARTSRQTARVDSMISSTLNNIGNATAAVEKSIAGPLRQVNGVLAGLRAGIETLGARPGQRPVKPTETRTTAGFTASDSASTSGTPFRETTPIDSTAQAEITPEAAARFVRDRVATERR